MANEKLETGEFNDIVSARLYELETQVKQLIIVKTSETQLAKQNARIQQCEDTLEKQAATLKEMKKSKADVEERISKMASKLEELTAKLEEFDTLIKEASIVKTTETQYALLDARIENGEK